MLSAELAQMAQFLHTRRDTIADHWYRAVASTSFAPLRAEQVRQRLNDLTEQVIALLLAEPLDRDAARSIGAALASLHYLEPQALAGTQEALAQQLVEGLSTDQNAALYPRLTALLAELAAGFAARAREIVLAEQEQIRLALVAERRQAQEALRESEARYRAISELTSDFAYTHRVEPDGTLVTDWVTPAYSRITGFAVGEVSVNSWRSIMHPDDLPVALQLLQSNLANQASVAEYRIFAKDGAIRWLRVYARPVWDEAQGRAVRIYGAAQDITEHKQAEKKLYEAEARYRTLVEQIPAITYIAALDEASTTLYISPQIETILGFSPTDYQARPDIWREQLHPDDRERMLAEVARCHATGEPLVSDYRMLTRDGRVVWFHDEAALVRDADGRPLFLQGVMLDITERKRAEDALRQSEETARGLLNATADAAFLIDVTGTVLALNQTTAKNAGKSTDELLGACIYDSLAPDVAKARKARVDEAVRSGKPVHFEDERGGRWFDNSLYPILDAQGTVARVAVYGRDITDQRQMRDLLVRRAREMEALYDTSLEINSQPDVPKLLQAIVQRAAGLVGTQAGGLYLIKPDGQTLELVVSHNLPGDYLGVKLHLGEGLAGRVAQTGKPMAIVDYLSWEERAAAYVNAPLRRVLGVPLKVGDTVIGVIDVTDDKRAGPFSEDEIRLVSLFADQAAIAVENARLYQAEREQREMAETLRDIGATLASTLDVNTVLERLLDQVGRVVPNDAAGIMLLEDDHAHVAHWRGHERFGIKDLAQGTFPIDSSRYLKQMLVTGKPVVVPDTNLDPNWVGVPGTEWLRSFAATPIRVQGKVVGFLELISTTPGLFGQAHAERLLAFADQAAVALENARLFEEARKTAERLQLLSRRLVEVQEAERRHIARELHDEVGQVLTGLQLLLEMSARQLGDAAPPLIPRTPLRGEGVLGRDHLSEAQKLTHDLLTRVREMSLDLRPAMLDDLGLLPALLWHLERFTAQTHVRVAFNHTLPEQRFAPEIETVAYRVVQEALTNVARHSGVNEASVWLWATQDTLGLQVEDRGTGFDPEAQLADGRGSGLSGMRERVALLDGQLTIESSPGAGACLTAELPLRQLSEES
jgi:PAS domain S-box-containing protein